MAQSGTPPQNPVGPASESSPKGSNQWPVLKSSLVLGLRATEMALDGLPIPGAKGCVRLILHVLETSDVC